MDRIAYPRNSAPMTRETKVGLLIGLGVILLVGIILTDYLSVVQDRQVPTMTDFAVEAQDSLVPPKRQGPSIGTYPVRGPRRIIETPDASASPRRPVESVPPRPQPRTVRRVIETPTAAQHGRQLPGTPEPDDGVGQLAVESLPPVVVPRPVRHIVASEQTLWHIAEKYYGDGIHWRKIQRANPTLIGAGGAVRAGVQLLIPQVTADRVDVTRRPSPAPDRLTVVTVQEGETLSSIAGGVLGDPVQWRALYQANRDRIKNPNRLKVGLQLRVPPQ